MTRAIKKEAGKRKKRVKILLIILIVLAILVLVGAVIFKLMMKNATIITYTTPDGKRETIILPSFAAMSKISEARGDCSYTAFYILTKIKDPPLIASPKIANALKESIPKAGYDFKFETESTDGISWTISFLREQNRLIYVIGPEKDKTSLEIKYEWPPCST